MRVLHVVAGVERGGGIGESVPRLCAALAKGGHMVVLATLDHGVSDAARQAAQAGVQLELMKPTPPASVYFSLGMAWRLPALVRAADVVHVHSNWTFPVWWACRCALTAGRPLVMSPRGCLDPVRLRHSAWKKRLVGWLDRYYLRRAAVIHATSQAEAEGVREFLKCESSKVLKSEKGGCERAEGERRTSNGRRPERAYPQIVVVPNGVEAGGRRQAASGSVRAREETANRAKDANGSRTRTVLYLGRLHPLKGLELLISAWAGIKCSIAPMALGQVFNRADGAGSKIANEFLSWQLVIAGPDEQGTLAGLREQVKSLGLEGQVTLGGPVYGDEKARIMASADLFVLPTRSENFGIVVAEALACGVPVICTKGAPWSELLGNSDSSKVLQCESSKVGETEDGGNRQSAVGGGDSASDANNNNFRTLELQNFRTSTGRCGWWVDIGEEPLAEALREAMRLTDEERHALGENGRRLVEAKYRWETVAREMAAVYSGIVNREP